MSERPNAAGSERRRGALWPLRPRPTLRLVAARAGASVTPGTPARSEDDAMRSRSVVLLERATKRAPAQAALVRGDAG
jgi:hypothetical protein